MLAEINPQSDDIPRTRDRGRSEPLLAFGRAVLRQRLPPWAVVVLLGLAIVCYTAHVILGPLVDQPSPVTVAMVDQRVAVVDERVSAIVSQLEQRIAERDRALEELVTQRIAAAHARCPRDVAAVLRYLVHTGAVVGGELPPDLQLCMLLDEVTPP
jgi:hypothetical protein